jgi:RHS repeat-associated protein
MQGVITERLVYDPWGRRRFASGLPDTLDSITGLATDRGYTMHEHLDEIGIIHMNGRVFDPLIGRFMSADPYSQAPGNLQSYNRYSYVMNNPLAFTDPSGYWNLKQAWKKVWHSKVGRFLISAAVGYFTGQWIGEIFKAGAIGANATTACASIGSAASGGSALTSLGGALAGAGGGFAAGLVGSGGDVKAGLQGALSGGLFGGIGATGAAEGWGSGQYIAAHAAAGCVTAAAGGGNCGAGAASGAFGKWVTIQTIDWESGVAQFTASTVAGGIGSVIGGGKFANGAETAAFGYLFNQALSQARSAMFRTGQFDDSERNYKTLQDKFVGGLETYADGMKTGAAVCGLANPGCRAVDLGVWAAEGFRFKPPRNRYRLALPPSSTATAIASSASPNATRFSTVCPRNLLPPRLLGFSVVDSTVAANKGDWSVAIGNVVGLGVNKWAQESLSALKFYPQQFVQGVGHAYDKVSGKLTEHVFQQSQKPQK